jgi:DNA-directed RNA polymerase subunit F
MIRNSEPLSIAEALEYIKKDGENESEIVGFMNKFNKINAKQAKELRKEIEGFDMIKMKPEYIVKIIDVLPESSEELNKIFVDVGLDEDETKKLLEAIKKFR